MNMSSAKKSNATIDDEQKFKVVCFIKFFYLFI